MVLPMAAALKLSMTLQVFAGQSWVVLGIDRVGGKATVGTKLRKRLAKLFDSAIQVQVQIDGCVGGRD